MIELDLFNDFNEKFLAEYRQERTQPTNTNHSFNEGFSDEVTNNLPVVQTVDNSQSVNMLQKQTVPLVPASSATISENVKQITNLQVFGHNVAEYIQALFPEGAPEGSRHKSALKLAYDLMILLDGNMQLVNEALLQVPWVQDVINERGLKEIEDIIDSAKKLLKKRESESLYDLRPTRKMQMAIEKVTMLKYSRLANETRLGKADNGLDNSDDIIVVLDRIGAKLERMFKHFPLLQLLCHGLKRKHYVAALFVGGGFAMTLMTRCWYRFWAEPRRKCRLNSIVELIGRSGSGKHIAVDLYKILMEPVKMADAAQIAALNRWNEERDQKSGADKNKTPRPKGIFRCLPSEASAAAIREAEFNAKEMVDGEEMSLHVSQFNSELDDLLSQQKKSYMNIEALFLKSLHNEPAGSFLKTSSSMVGEYDVHFNGVYTGTSNAISKQTTTAKFAKGEPQRLAAVPMGDSNFEMRENRVYTAADRERDERLKEWAYKLNITKGEIFCKDISDALHKWTARRMADAKDEQNKALEDLVKRPCWIACNLALPFIVSRHWDKMIEANGYWKCGQDFKTDKVDIDLTLTICDAQFAFQQYFFLGIGEKYYEEQQMNAVTGRHQQRKTILAFGQLPTVFTSDDVKTCYGYDSQGSVCSCLKRLQDDGLVQKIRTGEDKGKYRKLVS